MKVFVALATLVALAAANAEIVPNCPRAWNYATADQWGSLCPAWAGCNDMMQSPIDLATPARAGWASAPEYYYQGQSRVDMFNTGRAIKMPFDIREGNTFCTGGETFYLREVQFHTPSEHRVNGVEFDLEVQYVHDSLTGDDSNHLVVSVFYNRGMHSWFLDQLFFDLPEFDHCWCGNNRLESFAPFGEECDNGERNADVADACRTNCTLPRCGDGIVDKCEQCDDGAANSDATADACRTNCVRAACGDGVLDSEEECDDGNRHNLDGCSSICKLECGDSFANTDARFDPDHPETADNEDFWCTPQRYPACAGLHFPAGVEECDDGLVSTTMPQGCRAKCVRHTCGDGVTDPEGDLVQEECDDGSANSDTEPNACRSSCRLPSCGDGVLDNGEECDFIDNRPETGCNTTCTTMCGDGIVQDELKQSDPTAPGEECDEGSADNSDSANAFCRPGCTLAYCGDGIVDFAPINGTRDGEQCDDGAANGVSLPHHPGASDCVAGSTCTVRCDSTCTLRCGNGIVEPDFGEECDNTEEDNQLSSGICRPWCRLAFCGDGIVDPMLGEDCDDAGASATCTDECRRPFCGDNVTDPSIDGAPGEECDDGNQDNDDGCNTDCRLNCGNGRIDNGEECDDGDANSNTAANSCRSSVVDGATVHRCVKYFCGDGVTDALNGEACDDGPAGSATCRGDCTIPYCGDGTTDREAFGEECDNGAMNSDTAVDGCSTDCVLNRCRHNAKTWNATASEALFDPAMGFPMHNHSALCYSGSLAAPPCTEGTKWFVFEEPQLMSVLQYAQIRSVLPHAGSPFEGQAAKRPLQPTAGRTVTFCNDVARAPEAKCGNGWREGAEECDEGLRNSDSESDACRTNCKLARCGDGVVDMGAGEECEPPSTNGCMADCRLPTMMKNPYAPMPWSYKRTGDWWMQWAQCDGDMQSPINLVRDHTRDFGDADHTAMDGRIQYTRPVPVEFYNTAHLPVWKVNPNNGNTFTGTDGTQYELDHISIHSPSEHTIEGKSADFEVQLHHKTLTGDKWAAVAVLYNAGEMRNQFLDSFWFYLPRFTHQECGNGKVETLLAGDSEECDDGHLNSDFAPNACRTNCKMPSCGDGVVDRGEMCDDGLWNLNEGGHCRPTTCVLPFCGDGVTDPDEECDDGNNEDRDGCDKKCKSECGNGRQDGVEECDSGADNSMSPDSCRPDCRDHRCGDGVVDTDEECDLGENKNGDIPNHCREDCRLPTCGDGVTDPAFGEECDEGSRNSDDHWWCTADCKLQCGDGDIDADMRVDGNSDGVAAPELNEECDDGAENNGDSNSMCRSSCRLPSCGDGIIDDGMYGGEVFSEMCDEGAANFDRCCPGGNTDDAACTCPRAFCGSTCQPRCGNGIREPGEECDDGTMNNNHEPNCCRFDCTAPSCGDGILDAGEECDDGAATNLPTSHCRRTAEGNCVLRKCGDSIVDPGEECEVGQPGCTSTCHKLCGNGMKDAGEQCDDGHMNGDGADQCRPDCTLPFCGDGKLDSGEQCDDATGLGNAANQCRAGCTLPVCGDGITDAAFGEECDDGASNSDTARDGCSSTCTRNVDRQCIDSTKQVDLSGAFPTLSASKGVYCYQGSRARPPCAENYEWFVYEEVQHMSHHQAMMYKEIWPHPSSRGVQCSEGRTVNYKTLGSVCGNCKREGTEECDDGELNSDTKSGACRTNCRRSMCGDGVVDHTEGEQCEPSVHDGCDEFCRWMTSCPVSASGGSCPNNSCGASCPSGSCASAQQVPANSTVINVNFANMLSKSACTTCSR